MSTPTPLGPARGLNVVHLFCHPQGEVDAGALRKAIDEATHILDESLTKPAAEDLRNRIFALAEAILRTRRAEPT